jgi:anti-sigma factor RsiW
MMARCEESVPLLGPWIDGELEESDRAWLVDHVRGCDSCAQRKLLLEAQRSALREQISQRAEKIDLSRLSAVVLARIERERQRPNPWTALAVWLEEIWGARRLPISLATGAALAGVVAATFLLHRPPPPREQALVQLVSVDTVDFITQPGVVLQSGQTSIIWLTSDRTSQ